jgi:hypothetical protein
LTRVLSLLLLALPAFAQFAWKDLGDGRVELRDADRPVLVYNYGPQLKPGAPENRRRCCYIFPVYTPSGLSILDDFPRDHWHHRGLFWSWPVVEVGGKKYDIWMNFTAKHRPDKPPKTAATARSARLDVQDFWQIEGGRDIVKENVRLTALPTADNARELEVELTWEALKEPVTLAGSEEKGKSYGGFSARFAPRENTVVRADGQVLTKDEDLVGHQWAELEAVYGGRKAALRITSDDRNPGVPLQWCLRNYGFVGASFPGRTASVDHYTLEPGKPLTLRFRVRLADLP